MCFIVAFRWLYIRSIDVMLTVWTDFGLKNFDLIRLIDKTESCLALSSLRFFAEVLSYSSW